MVAQSGERRDPARSPPELWQDDSAASEERHARQLRGTNWIERKAEDDRNGCQRLTQPPVAIGQRIGPGNDVRAADFGAEAASQSSRRFRIRTLEQDVDGHRGSPSPPDRLHQISDPRPWPWPAAIGGKAFGIDIHHYDLLGRNRTRM